MRAGKYAQSIDQDSNENFMGSPQKKNATNVALAPLSHKKGLKGSTL